MTKNLGYIKAKFVPHTLEPHEKDLRILDYLTKNRIVTINHSPYSPDMAPCDLYLFGKLHLAMKDAIPKDDLKKSFDNLLDRANRRIQCEGDSFEGDQ